MKKMKKPKDLCEFSYRCPDVERLMNSIEEGNTDKVLLDKYNSLCISLGYGCQKRSEFQRDKR